MTRTLEDVRDDLVLAINEHNERGDNAHIGGLLWAGGEVNRLIKLDELWQGRKTSEDHPSVPAQNEPDAD